MKKCPLDQSKLERKKYEYVSIWQCPTCHGTHLTQEKINNLVRKQETTQDELRELVRKKASEDTQELIRCPTCHFKMQKKSAFSGKLKSHRGSFVDFQIDLCPSCESIWLDGSELEKLELDFQQSTYGTEQGKHYQSYAKLSPQEKREFLEAIGNSVPDQADTFFSAVAVAVKQALSRFRKTH